MSPNCGSLFLVKLQVLTINGGDGICDGAYFHFHAEVQASGLCVLFAAYIKPHRVLLCKKTNLVLFKFRCVESNCTYLAESKAVKF